MVARRCLVIGGNGFIGSHVVEELVAAGHEVTVFDRLSGGWRFAADGVRVVRGDFLNVHDLAEAMRDQEIVYHLLSTSTPASAEADPLFDVRTNVTGSIELFRLAAAEGVDHLYFASTGGAIYGDTAASHVDEEMRPDPVSPYAIGKLAIEGYLGYFRRTRGLQSTVLRISNPYGPRQGRQSIQGVIPIFLRNLAAGQPLTVFGDGSMIRDYIYIEDLARLLTLPLGRQSPYTLYNVGSGTPYSLDEVLDSIRRVTGQQPVVQHRPVPPTFVQRIALSTRRFNSAFEVKDPLIDLDEGISRTWDSIRSEL